MSPFYPTFFGYMSCSFRVYLPSRWRHMQNLSTPILLIRDAYESIVLTSFFYLLLQYPSPDTQGQKEIFRKVTIEKWVFPLGWIKWRPEVGLSMVWSTVFESNYLFSGRAILSSVDEMGDSAILFPSPHVSSALLPSQCLLFTHVLQHYPRKSNSEPISNRRSNGLL